MKTQSDYNREFRHRHPEKAKAHTAIRQRIRSGSLVAQPCERCNATPTHAHHEDYTKPLEVVWLCNPCHIERHRELVAQDPEKWGNPNKRKEPRPPRPKALIHPESWHKTAEELRQQGKTYRDIAETLGTTPATVYKWLNTVEYK